MTVEFERIALGTAKSPRGFTVTWLPPGRVDYTDANGTVKVDVEVMMNPLRTVVYRGSAGLHAMTDDRAEEIIANIIEALEFLGQKAERGEADTWKLEPGDWEKYK